MSLPKRNQLNQLLTQHQEKSISQSVAAELAKHIKVLNIKEGDVIVCKDPHAIEAMKNVRIPGMNFSVPLIYAPGGLEIATREQLVELIERLDATPSVESEDADIHGG